MDADGLLLMVAVPALMGLATWLLTRGDAWARQMRAVAHQVAGVEADLEARRLTGVVEGVAVYVAPCEGQRDTYQLRFQTDEHPGVAVNPHDDGEEDPAGVRTGDMAFDRAVRITGLSDAEALAALDPTTRWRLRTAFQAGWRHDRGAWASTLSVRRYPIPEIVRAVEEGVALGGALRHDGSVDDALVQRALADPDLDVRRRAVDLLFERGAGPTHAGTLFDGGAEVAMHVVGALPRPEQLPRLRELVDHADPDTAWSATQRLAADGVDDRVRRGWVRGLDHQATRLMAVNRLAEAGEVGDVAPLQAVAAQWLPSPEARRAAEAIAAIQARAEGAQAGTLALANRPAGEVAIVETRTPHARRPGPARRTES